MKSGKIVASALIVWFCLALAVGFAGWFRSASAPVVAATVWTLTILALLACWIIGPIRAWVAIVDLNWLVAFHLIRLVAGIYFLVDCRAGSLSPAFAIPAGYGDIAVAITAALILFVPRFRASRTVLLVWNTVGLIDIVFVAIAALRIGLRDWPGMAPLRELPLSLLPTFIVPLIIASHVLIFARRARRDKLAPASQ